MAAVALFAPAADSIPNTADSTHLVLVMLAGVVTVAPLLGFAFAAHRVPLTVLGPLQYLVPTVNFLIGWLAYEIGAAASRHLPPDEARWSRRRCDDAQH